MVGLTEPRIGSVGGGSWGRATGKSRLPPTDGVGDREAVSANPPAAPKAAPVPFRTGAFSSGDYLQSTLKLSWKLVSSPLALMVRWKFSCTVKLLSGPWPMIR